MFDDLSPYRLDKRWIRRSFDAASTTYDAAAVLQTEVRNLLLARLDLTELSPACILDAGTGTGHGARELQRRYPGARVIALDSSAGMLRVAAKQRRWRKPFMRLCADAEQLPLLDGSVDLVLSNLMLPWTVPDAAFAEFRRVLKPRGLLSFTTLGPDTLRELRSAWNRATSAAEEIPRVNRFIDMHDLGDALVRCGFAAPVLDVERYTLQYRDVGHLIADLKALGTRNAAAGRPKGLTAPSRFAAMRSAYELERRDGRLPATYEIVFGHAWVQERRDERSADGAIHVSLDDVRRQLRRDGLE